MGTGLVLHHRPHRRLGVRAPHVVAGIRATVRKYLPQGGIDDDRRSRLLERADRAFAAGLAALSHSRAVAPDGTGRVPGTGDEEASARVFAVMLAELVPAVEDHPDRHRLLVDAAVAMHRVMAGAEEAPSRPRVDDDAAVRRRIARDVHDWMGSGLSLAQRQLELHALETCCQRQPGRADRLGEARRTLQELQHLTSRLIDDLRAAPASVDVVEDLREYARRAGAPDGSVGVELRGDQSTIPPHVRGELFLVLREALRNALAHAGASTVRIVVDVVPGRVRARVEDDGIGVRPGPRRRGGAGIASMHERIAALGGRCTVGPRSPGGTVVEVDVEVTTETGVAAGAGRGTHRGARAC